MRLTTNFSLFRAHAWKGAGLVVIQQLIAVSSTIWITRFIASIQRSEPWGLWLGLYLASLILPYLPGALALISLTKAKAQGCIDYVNYFVAAHSGRVTEWADQGNRSHKESILSGQAIPVIRHYLDYSYHLLSTSLNVILNIVTVAIVLAPSFLVAFAVGLSAAAFVLYLQKKRKGALALDAQQSQIRWTAILLRLWDNVVLGNRHNMEQWIDRSTKRAGHFQKSTVHLESFSQGISVAMAFCLMVPVFATTGYLAFVNQANIVWLGMLAVVLPRLFLILSYSYDMVLVLADIPMQRKQFKTVTDTLDLSQFLDPHHAAERFGERIQWEKLQVSGLETKVSDPELLDKLPAKGRITCCGENGAGKTSWLLLLKLRKGDGAFYLPAKHHLDFATDISTLSTGQSAAAIVGEIFREIDTPVVLLDEWDANLDHANTAEISKMIDQLAERVCVIETRHNRSAEHPA